MKKKVGNKIVLYQNKSGAIEFRGDFDKETIWATQEQIAEVFELERSVVTKHIGNILKDKELDKNSVCAKYAHTAADGKTYQVQFYNLDIILSVGYRASSKKAIVFRQWATKTLRQYVTEGFAINKKLVAKNYEQFLATVKNIKHFLPTGVVVDNSDILELVSTFADTWLSLEAYDKDLLTASGSTKQKVKLTSEKLTAALSSFKNHLLESGEATEIFGQERQNGSISGIVGSVMQSFGGQELYGTAEEKAAHLLYFMVKNHPFVDGNKRSGAYAFIWFLRQAKILDITKLTSAALTALTILVAESNPKDKERMIKLILTLLAKRKKGK